MVTLTEKGMFCESGGFYIDPTRVVEVALITHAHSDHARRGSRHYYCVTSSVGLLKRRIGAHANITGVEYGQCLEFGKVQVSFHPAGHILGSAQIRLQEDSRVWVISGDYKREPDPTCEPFEVVPCDTFITEATFGNPRYQWGDCSRIGADIFEWWQQNRRQSKNSLLYCYALGKAQRVLAELATHTAEAVHVHGETAELTSHYRELGVKMVPTISLEHLDAGVKLRGVLVVAPKSIANTTWLSRLENPITAFASGWMQTGAFGMNRQVDRGFVLSDHADWPALLRTIEQTGARRILVQHSREGAKLISHLKAQAVNASALVLGGQVQGDLF